MIRFLRGEYIRGPKGSIIVVSSSGVGFEVFVPDNSPIYNHVEGESIEVFTSMMVREDDIRLFGFHNRENLDLFELLITVNGVGAKAALALMSALSLVEIKKAIAFGDIKSISSANGIGKKTSERIILELKDKVGTFEGNQNNNLVDDTCFSDEKSEAVKALMSLGYSRPEAATAIGNISDQDLKCEEYIKKALKDSF